MKPKTRVMVAEDEYFVALDTSDLLTDAGYEVVAVVGTGEEAVAVAARLRPDVTLMDITLGGKMDGIEAAIALREMGLPVIFASAHSDPPMLARGAMANPLAWLTKPFDQVAMTRAMSRASTPKK